ncbi:Uncharacterised protein [Phocoenobacter uteri]|uniref:Uncharacterized protein n=1 Tax=Phocoenobacter uteri TaxID=146806 RepID=A0A379CAU6_9PAST|nr:hypothetical protein [Phocoenobacter uteri]MDG6881378.1 hypothetical protein [Phocoenobacter uteri]SUB59403.1 Uncharacterised protein [Phocoenobacter uteri]
MKKHILLSIALLGMTPFTNAEETTTVETIQNNTVEVVDSITGVTYELNDNGEFARIRSSGEAELEFGDRKDIRIATQKATLRAKANIAKFLSERVTSDEVMEEMTKTAANSKNKEKEVTRENVSTYTETIKNSAEALLRGVITVKNDINKAEHYVLVEVGISPKTLAEASFIKEKLADDESKQNSENNALSSEKKSQQNRIIKKVKNYDNF